MVQCSVCRNEICSAKDFKFFGFSGEDIFKMIKWLENENVTVKDLACSSIRHHYWEKMRVADMIMSEPKP